MSTQNPPAAGAAGPGQNPGGDDPKAAEQLLPLVYDALKDLARYRMGRERAEHTLQATALVHEAYLRLARDNGDGGGEGRWANRAQFFHAAAEAMRRILIEHARARGRVKRGGPCLRRVPISVLDLAASPDADQVLALDEAIARLAEESAEVAAVVRLRFFAGLSVEETAETLGISARSVNRHWSYARAWLFEQLKEHDAQERE